MRNDLILFTIGRISERAKIFLTGELRERGMGELGVAHTEILGILTDAALAQSDMPETHDNPGHHAAVAALINKILAGGNSVRRR